MIAQAFPTLQADSRLRYATTRYPDLELMVDGNYVTFTYWETCEVFLVEASGARLMASSDVNYLKPEVYEHVRELLGELVNGLRQAELVAA
jgi:hypothetical protein